MGPKYKSKDLPLGTLFIDDDNNIVKVIEERFCSDCHFSIDSGGCKPHPMCSACDRKEDTGVQFEKVEERGHYSNVEIPVNSEIYTNDMRLLRVIPNKKCTDCFFSNNCRHTQFIVDHLMCSSTARTDETSVIFMEVKS